MEKQTIILGAHKFQVVSCNTVIVGTGAAGYNAAINLHQKGQTDIAMVTENIKTGTSRNTGSDKQTYYKLSLSGDDLDSVQSLAETLFKGQCMDGDVALCEASLSAQCFYKLVDLGVPFPKNSFGEYVGYKTDHDPNKRATSVGPYTSKMMTECLEKATLEKGIAIFDSHQVVSILTDSKKENILGLLCLNVKQKEYVLFSCKNVVYATGGPAGMYANSVYPHGHYGASGIAFAAGVKGKNLTEWQYGMASVKPRWNVSGTYMQALPTFISTDKNGENAREFLLDFFDSSEEMLSQIFMKGYQWPFDVRKIANGSSIIDVLVYIESCIKGRRIFLDFRANSKNKEVCFDKISQEAKAYLENAKACFGTPIERLKEMNTPAFDFYKEKGVDLETEMLEIALCAQHNNGGLAIDKWWQTNLNGFFAIGEVSGSHGVYRPGGSALNSGQVGGVRASEYINAKRKGAPVDIDIFAKQVKQQVLDALKIGNSALTEDELKTHWQTATQRMSEVGAAIRNAKEIEKALQGVKETLALFKTNNNDVETNANDTEINKSDAKVNIKSNINATQANENNFDTNKTFGNTHFDKKPSNTTWRKHRLYDMLLSQFVYLSAMVDYSQNCGQSRGSALYTIENGNLPNKKLPELFRFIEDDGSFADQTQEICFDSENFTCNCSWRKIRPIPQKDDFFENVWKTFRENGNVD